MRPRGKRDRLDRGWDRDRRSRDRPDCFVYPGQAVPASGTGIDKQTGMRQSQMAPGPGWNHGSGTGEWERCKVWGRR